MTKRYERVGGGGVGRCRACNWTDWWSNLMHQGCLNESCPNHNHPGNQES